MTNARTCKVTAIRDIHNEYYIKCSNCPVEGYTSSIYYILYCVSFVEHLCSIKGCVSVTGCSRTHSAVTLGDWSDPLDPDVETQMIYKQLLQGRDKLRSVSANIFSQGAVHQLSTRGLYCNTGVLCSAAAGITVNHTFIWNCMKRQSSLQRRSRDNMIRF